MWGVRKGAIFIHNISSTTFHPKVDEYPKCQQGWEKERRKGLG
jgi:hypothetical protein